MSSVACAHCRSGRMTHLHWNTFKKPTHIIICIVKLTGLLDCLMQRSALVFRLQVQKNLDTIMQKSGKTSICTPGAEERDLQLGCETSSRSQVRPCVQLAVASVSHEFPLPVSQKIQSVLWTQGAQALLIRPPNSLLFYLVANSGRPLRHLPVPHISEPGITLWWFLQIQYLEERRKYTSKGRLVKKSYSN